jgi:hypothetical protein
MRKRERERESKEMRSGKGGRKKGGTMQETSQRPVPDILVFAKYREIPECRDLDFH